MLLVGGYPIRQLALVKMILVGWFSGNWTQSVPITLADGLCDMGGGGNKVSVRPTWLGNAGRAPFELYPGIYLTTQENHRKPVSDFSQSLIGTGAFQFAELRGSPHRLTLSRNSVIALMWSAKNGILKSSWICLLLTYQVALVAMRRHLDCIICSFRTWLWAADLQIGHA
jgi:hypothetical protein